jgi:2,3-dihydroxyphenylpropionate 1,2-dioxygenase
MAGSAVVCMSHSPLIEQDSLLPEGSSFLSAVAEARADVERFHPELVVMFGPDHARALTNVTPAFTIVESAQGYGDWGTPEGAYDVPSELAVEVASECLHQDFDVAVGSAMRLDHGFGQTFCQLFGSLDTVPCLPVVVNCARAPLPSLSRVIDFGSALHKIIGNRDERVLIIGSGGLSHQPPSMSPAARALPEAEREALARQSIVDAARFIDPTWDRWFLQTLAAGDWATLRAIDGPQLDGMGSGTNEVRTWIAAWAAAGGASGTFVYEPVARWITGMGVLQAFPDAAA